MHIDFPAGRIFAKANNVIRVERTSEVDGNPTLEIGGMVFKRYFKDPDSDVVYFPLDGILEAMIGDGKELLFDSGDIVISYLLDGDPTNDGNPAQIKVVNGASDTLFSSAPSVDGYGFPQPKKIRIHTSIFPHSVPQRPSLLIRIFVLLVYIIPFSLFRKWRISLVELLQHPTSFVMLRMKLIFSK